MPAFDEASALKEFQKLRLSIDNGDISDFTIDTSLSERFQNYVTRARPFLDKNVTKIEFLQRLLVKLVVPCYRYYFQTA